MQICTEGGKAYERNPDRSGAIVRLITTYYKTLMRIAFTYVKNTADAEDIVQEVFPGLYKDIPEFKSSEHEKAWLIRCTINRCKNHLGSVWFRRLLKA